MGRNQSTGRIIPLAYSDEVLQQMGINMDQDGDGDIDDDDRAMLDGDGDGVISHEEAAQYKNSLIDADGDGVVTFDEAMAAAKNGLQIATQKARWHSDAEAHGKKASMGKTFFERMKERYPLPTDGRPDMYGNLYVSPWASGIPLDVPNKADTWDSVFRECRPPTTPRR
jgi:hypothetical protein